jgi:hypothetical protein
MQKKTYEKPVIEQVGVMTERTMSVVETSCCICELDCSTEGGVCECKLGTCKPR